MRGLASERSVSASRARLDVARLAARAFSACVSARCDGVRSVYNNFPRPEKLSAKHVDAIEKAAQGVLDARATFSDSSLAGLYDPLSMPRPQMRAHQALDQAVDAAYGRKSFASDAERVAFLFEIYRKYRRLLPDEGKPRRRKARPAARV